MGQIAQNDKNCSLLLRVSKGGLGHIGFSTVASDGRTTHYDFAVAGACKNKKQCSTSFNVAAVGASVAGYLPIAMAYATTGFYTAFKLGAPLPIMIASSVAALVYSSLVTGAVGTLNKSDEKPFFADDETYKLPITRQQYDQIKTFCDKNKHHVYSLGFANCVNFTSSMLKHCGLKLPVRFCFNTPAHFVKKLKQANPQMTVTIKNAVVIA